MNSKDQIYLNPVDKIADFAFDDKVAAVFPDMIQRSVPGYSTIIGMTGVIAGRYATENSFCFDLGCSLGASTLAIAHNTADKNIQIIGVDNSAAMIERCAKNLAPFKHIQLRCENIEDTLISNASVVVMNFSLQFIVPDQRYSVLQNIFNNMLKGGILVLSEKIAFSDPHLQQLNTDLHYEFKKANGYSDLEISQKRAALENILISETLETHQSRLREIGFSSCDVWFQCFNFASLVAIK